MSPVVLATIDWTALGTFALVLVTVALAWDTRKV